MPPIATIGMRVRRDPIRCRPPMDYLEKARRVIQLEIDEKAFGGEHPRVIDAMRFVANTLICMENYDAADSLLGRAQTISPDNGALLFESARLYHGRGDATQADSLFTRWLEIIEGEQGRESAMYAYSQARCRAIAGDRELALQLLQTALDRGYSDPWIARNLEFESLRGDPRFEAIVTEVKRRSGIADLVR